MAPSPKNPGEEIGAPAAAGPQANAYQAQPFDMQGAVWPIISNPSQIAITIDDDDSDKEDGNTSPGAGPDAIPNGQGHINSNDPAGGDDDEELFVQQDNFIDLTMENEQDAEDRRRRIANIMAMSGPDDLDAPAIKQEDQQFMAISIPRANGTAGGQSPNSSRSPSTAQPIDDHSQDYGYVQANDYPDYPEGYDHVLDIDQPRANDQASDNGSEEGQYSSNDSAPDTLAEDLERMQLLMTKCHRLHLQRGKAGLTKQDRFNLASWNSEIDALKEKIEVDDEDNSQYDSEASDNSKKGSGASPDRGAATPPEGPPEDNVVLQGPKPRTKPPKTAGEYWERQYATMGVQASAHLNQSGKRPAHSNPAGEPAAKKPNRRNGRPQKKHAANAAFEKVKLTQMLRSDNPLVARAAIGKVALPRAIQSTSKGHQWQQILSNITNTASKRSIQVDRKIIQEASKSFGNAKCKARDGRWLLPGMKTTLFHHQLVGVRWMMGQEYSPEEPHGGILADEMGLGKTLEILAAIATNRPSEEDLRAGRGITLIVTPASSIAQWMSEIDRHCSWEPNVLHYKHANSLREEMWRKSDIM